MTISQVNQFLKDNKKRYKVDKFLGEEGGSFVKQYFFKTTTNRHMIVTTENDIIKRILVQVDQWKDYTYSVNGQPGRNTKQIY